MTNRNSIGIFVGNYVLGFVLGNSIKRLLDLRLGYNYINILEQNNACIEKAENLGRVQQKAKSNRKIGGRTL